MLPAQNRVRKSGEFSEIFREGRRSGNRLLVVHAVTTATNADLSKVGFVVGKKVGNSVIRHRVTRRLRHLVRPLLPEISARLVIRALPAIKNKNSREIEAALFHALGRLNLPGLNLPENETAGKKSHLPAAQPRRQNKLSAAPSAFETKPE